MEIRLASFDDIPAVVALSSGLFAEDGGLRDAYLDVGWPAREGHRYYRAVLTTHGAACWIAVEDGRTIGYLVARVNGPYPTRPIKVAELENVFVEPDARDKGVGTGLVLTFARWAASQGARRMSVTAYAANERAIAFYRRHGFEPKSLSLESAVEPGQAADPVAP
ncbi:GNAT family N-acetyltransferase [Rugosimonospora acidiphila]